MRGGRGKHPYQLFLNTFHFDMYCFQPPSPSKYSISTLSSSLSCSSNKARERVEPMCMKNQCSREGKKKLERKKLERKKLEREYHSSSNSAPASFLLLFYSFPFLFLLSLFSILFSFLRFSFFSWCAFKNLSFLNSSVQVILVLIFHHDTRSKKSVRVLYQFPGATFFITVTVQPRVNKKTFSGRRKKKKNQVLKEVSPSQREERKNEVRVTEIFSERSGERKTTMMILVCTLLKWVEKKPVRERERE